MGRREEWGAGRSGEEGGVGSREEWGGARNREEGGEGGKRGRVGPRMLSQNRAPTLVNIVHLHELAEDCSSSSANSWRWTRLSFRIGGGRAGEGGMDNNQS